MSRSNSTTSFGSLGEREMHGTGVSRSRDSAVDLPMDGEGSRDNSRSNFPQDEDVGVFGQVDPDQPSKGSGVPYYDSFPRRSPSDGGMANSHQRVVLPGGGDPSHYELMAVHCLNNSPLG